MISKLWHNVAHLQANCFNSRSSQIFSPGIILHSCRQKKFLSWRTSFLLTTTYRKGHQLKSCVWISLCSRNVWRKSCLMTWLMEKSVGRLHLWAPSIHTSSGLCRKVSFGPHVCLSEAILNPVFHWHTDYFAWAELQLELMLHSEHSHCLLVLKKEIRVFFLIIICLLYL